MNKPPVLTIHSTPVVSTFVYDEQRRILFDCGDGASLVLGGKILKVKNIFITHADRDHINGLPQATNVLGKSSPTIHHPPGSGSFNAMQAFLNKFDPLTCSRVNWHAINPGDNIELTREWSVTALKTFHFLEDEAERHRSLAYRVIKNTQKLRPDLRGASQAKIDAARIAEGRDSIMIEESVPYYVISGDTIPMSAGQIGDTPYLLHECTFLEGDFGGKMGEHSRLVELFDILEKVPLKGLLLYHISQRFKKEEGSQLILNECKKRGISYPVSAVFSGETCYDAFSQIIYQPS